LRGIFGQIAGTDLDDRIVWAVDTLATILRLTDMSGILSDFGKRSRREDPVVHFYETFLAEYDPKMLEARGVYYTPEPVVGYILKEKFGIKNGLADSTKIRPHPRRHLLLHLCHIPFPTIPPTLRRISENRLSASAPHQ
jgi:hypothetical protein